MINKVIEVMIYFIVVSFWLLIVYYTVLFSAGTYFRLKERNLTKNKNLGDLVLKSYPSVALLIPAYNEGVVIADTLYHMSKLEYPGKLDIYLLDDSSVDDTGEIAKYYSNAFDYFHYVKVPKGFPKGKSRVLNYGAKITDSEYIAVYDADNQPEKYALKLLVETAELTQNSCGSVGYVKTLNFYKNALTRMIALEFSIFQIIMQCGRWQLSKLGTYNGTNMLVRRTCLEEAGHWDVNAIAEDFELSVRMSANGYVCPVVPESRTWEQEPENFKVWFKQRSRWMLGNIYIIDKAIRTPEWRKKRALKFTINIVAVYFVFILLLLLSHGIFLFGVGGANVFDNIAIPSIYVWFLSWLFYLSLLIGSQFIDSTITLGNIITSMLMYLTYAQFWIVLALRAIVIHIRQKLSKKENVPKWDKTNRF